MVVWSEQMKDPQIALLMTLDDFQKRLEDAMSHAVAANAREPELLTASALCERLDISRPTLRKLRAAGLPCITVGTGLRFRLTDVLRWLGERNG